MPIVGSIAILILVLVAWEALFWALKQDVVGIALFKLRVATRRPLPVGYYRPEHENPISVGKPDTVVVFKMPYQHSAGRGPVTHVALTDSTTRFSVGDADVDADTFLEAYDDQIGTLVVHVQEAGRIATLGIDTDTRRGRE